MTALWTLYRSAHTGTCVARLFSLISGFTDIYGRDSRTHVGAVGPHPMPHADAARKAGTYRHGNRLCTSDASVERQPPPENPGGRQLGHVTPRRDQPLLRD